MDLKKYANKAGRAVRKEREELPGRR